MLKQAWYLITDPDYWKDVHDSPRLAQAPDLEAMLEELFGDEAGMSPAHTVTAIETMLRMVEHLSDAIPHAAVTVADRKVFTRLLHGFNLLLTYLAQLSGRLAHQVDTGTGTDLSGLSAAQRAALSEALALASSRLVESAALYGEAFLGASGRAHRKARR